MNNNTKYNNVKITPVLMFLAIIGYIIIPLSLIYGIIKIYKAPITETGIFQSPAIKILFLVILILFLCLFVFSIIGEIIGLLKGRLFIRKEIRKAINTNPYIYYRELPNNYGIGVTSLLFDSKIENYKDIIAVILDLCAKKYLSLIKIDNRYCIKVLKSVDDNLLNNEKYILNLLISQNIKNIDYDKWYNHCLQDGINLGLYFHSEESKEILDNKVIIEKTEKDIKKAQRLLSFFLALITFIGDFIISYLEQIKMMNSSSELFLSIISLILMGIVNIILAAIFALIVFGIVYVSLIIPFYIIRILMVLVNVGNQTKELKYNMIVNNHLTRTDNGVIELQKLISFKNFLSDFGHFVDRKPEEVVLWDRYLSYAQVFGLTNEIMKSGYKQLVDNSSFQIDDIDNITISNLEIK